ncbi:hypothetical protein CERZMDRAFT_101852 [Cercospora zeae-maydis SCOH1-5]|uniref:Uncharacterized protein n=1 Tax=Cercospora zeae-maydis SCOH1-5 TaxID=717836 RepID=A0A6A6F233_9PEZI|nr:hypothetical protein CERZMDRAFT_101852 [Cercospora zeae-maydis SCOH1-5]
MARTRNTATSTKPRSKTHSAPAVEQAAGHERDDQARQHHQEHAEEGQTRCTDGDIRTTLCQAAEYAESKPSTTLAMYHDLYMRCLDSSQATTRLADSLHQELLPGNRTMHSVLDGILQTMMAQSKDRRTRSHWNSLKTSAWGESLDLVKLWAHFTVDGTTLPPGRFIGGLCDLSGGETSLEAGLDLLERARMARIESRELRARHEHRAQPRGTERRWATQDTNLAIQLWVEQDPGHRSAGDLTNYRDEQTEEQKRAAAAKLRAKRARAKKTGGLCAGEGDAADQAHTAASDGEDTESNVSLHGEYAQRGAAGQMAALLNPHNEDHERRSGLHNRNMDNEDRDEDGSMEISIELGRNGGDGVADDAQSPGLAPAFSPISDDGITMLDDWDNDGTPMDQGSEIIAEHANDDSGLKGGEDSISISELPSLGSRDAPRRLPSTHLHYHWHLEYHHPPRRRSPSRNSHSRSAPASPSPRPKEPFVAAETEAGAPATTSTSTIPSATSQTQPHRPPTPTSRSPPPNMPVLPSTSSQKRQRTGGHDLVTTRVMQDMSLGDWLGIFRPARSALRSLPIDLENGQVRASMATEQQSIAVLEQPASPDGAGGMYMVVVRADGHTTLFAPFADSADHELACPIPVSEVLSMFPWHARKSVVVDHVEEQAADGAGPAEPAGDGAAADEVTALAIGAAFLSSGRPIPPIDHEMLDVWRYCICLTNLDKLTDLPMPYLDAGPTTPLVRPSVSGIGRDYASDVDTLKKYCTYVEHLRKAQKEAKLIRSLLVQAARGAPVADVSACKDVQGLEHWCKSVSDMLSKTTPGSSAWHSQQASLKSAQRDLDAARAKLPEMPHTTKMRKHVMDMLAVLSSRYEDEIGKFEDCVAGFLHGLDDFAKECKGIAKVCFPDC